MILIKHYPNRKLYDTRAKQYITLEQIADLVHAGEEIQVMDHESGEDQTALTLAQIILEQEKRQKRGLPHVLLLELIRAGAERSSLNSVHLSEDEFVHCLERLGMPSYEDISRINHQLDELSANLDTIQKQSRKSV